jgi:hypothetical protein
MANLLQHYVHFEVTTKHLDSLLIMTLVGQRLIFPSIPSYSTEQLLDYHRLTVVFPSNCPQPSIIPTVSNATSEASLNCLLAHQCLGHGYDHIRHYVSTTITSWSSKTPIFSTKMSLHHLRY